MPAHTVQTSIADISVLESDGVGPAVLMLHGNSSCKEVFGRQVDSPLGRSYRLIAFDLPGHGASSDAREPASTYTLSGYAAAGIEVLRQLGVARAAVVGWSLGGHIALNMISRFPGLSGVMISGTPPVPGSLEGMMLGFQQSPNMALSSARDWSDADAETWARVTAGAQGASAPFMLAAARRAAGLAREIFFADALAGRADDQRQIAETATVPLAIVNGADDPFVNIPYFDTVRYANLWSGEVHNLAGVGHAPFWEAPERFNPLLERFLADVAAI
ncbi:MAG: alpha/beta hydrolase [Caulobacteraceae bacterium]|nr:alpha/beta hydrolase [Caulobacteraceae bacterium]